VTIAERLWGYGGGVGAVSSPAAPKRDAWQQAALHEGVARSPELTTPFTY
jgi:hypothetical protein